MNKILEILHSDNKPKMKVTLLANEIKKDESLVDDLVNIFESLSTGEQGHLMESLEYATQEQPETAASQIGFVIQHLGHPAPRIKWESSRIIANMAFKFPDLTEQAIPDLLKNTEDPGTVVRWSTAFALGEIAKESITAQETLIPIMKDQVEKEKNNGVRNVYRKALSWIEKQPSRHNLSS
jgi:HEAT repeat protein